MRTHAQRSGRSTEGRSAARRGNGPVNGDGAGRGAPAPATGGAGTPVPGHLTTDDVERLQAQAGNRATVQALRSGVVVQRALSVDQAESIARRLEDAMSGWGTDEEAIYGALAGRTPTDWQAIQEAFRHLYRKDLEAELVDELTEGEMARVRAGLAGTREAATLPDAEQETARQERSRSVAMQLVDAMRGWGTEEDQIFNALEGRDAGEIDEIRRQYRELTGRYLERDLREELSGSDLRRAIAAIESGNAGTFRNRVSQEMTEGVTTVVQGYFEWEIRGLSMQVHVEADFQPDKGVVPPMAMWQQQIRDTWNVFALEEPGGMVIPIDFDFSDVKGAERTIRVKQNKIPGQRSQEDRANAGMWFPVMQNDTAPHEFGHLIGLQDEYQRTHGDFQRITGEDKTGPENASGMSPDQIAVQLRNALYAGEKKDRATKAQQVLTNVGLIKNAIPQQGDFAQSVMEAYDTRFGRGQEMFLLEQIRDRCEEGSTWNLLTVFSYASGTVMGNPGTVGVAPHEHPVEARHLQPMLDAVSARYPSFAWSLKRR